MRIRVKNLGPLRQAEFELGQMTIICGSNNTGKTYATYALYGFLSFWHEAFPIPVEPKIIHDLFTNGTARLDSQDYCRKINGILADACKMYTTRLPMVFASDKKYFAETEFRVTVDEDEIHPLDTFRRTMGAAKSQIFSIAKEAGEPFITVSLLVEKNEVNVPQDVVSHAIGEAIKDVLFGRLFPNPFIASAERTGAAIFRNELNFARNRLLEQMGSMERELDAFELLDRVYSDYALPVRRNVDFTRRLEDSTKKESFISKDHPRLLDDFSEIIGGEYTVTRSNELFFVPKGGRRVKLTMDESSSAVRSLLDIGFYLRHVAQQDDLLMIDEPELNLHPENQRRVARLLASLSNLGIKIFATTHSDYFVKELSTLIMLSGPAPRLKQLAEREGYQREELLTSDKIKLFVAERSKIVLEGSRKKSNCLTLIPARIDPGLGIRASSFDLTIDEMNRVQLEIVWGEDQECPK